MPRHRKPDPIKPKPHPHPHPGPHSGTTFIDDPSVDTWHDELGQAYRQTDPHYAGRRDALQPPRKPARLGSVQHAVDQIIAAVRGLSGQHERNCALGYALARLTEQGVIKGTAACHAIALHETNRYAHVGE